MSKIRSGLILCEVNMRLHFDMRSIWPYLQDDLQTSNNSLSLLSQIPSSFPYSNAAIPKAAIPTTPPASMPGIAVGAAAPGLDEDEAAAVLEQPVCVTPFTTLMQLADAPVCVAAVLLGIAAEDMDPEAVVPGAPDEPAAPLVD